MQEELEPVKADIVGLRADIAQIKGDTGITRETANMLGEWVEIASDTLKIKYPVSK